MKYNVVSAILDQGHLILYLDTGEKKEIPQGNPLLKPILDAITPVIMAGGMAQITIDNFETPNPYKTYEETSSGLVRFFRTSVKKVKELMGGIEKPMVVPVVRLPRPEAQEIIKQALAANPPAPENISEVEIRPADDETRTTRMQAATAEILKTAKPVTTPGFANLNKSIDPNQEQEQEETIVAVIGKTMIPGMENLSPQIMRSLEKQSQVGLNNFLTRLSKVISQRQHSVADLLKFMSKSDLPIADDGCIIAYKSLEVVNKPVGKYVDVYSRKVYQRLGDYIHMDPKLVDHDRRIECSNGLHVGRRGYMGGFGGNGMVLIKVAPEDVIAVPVHDANKMRVCGYHIIIELEKEVADLVRANKEFTSSLASQQLLGRAIAGDHVRKLRAVTITQSYGSGLIYKDLESNDTNKRVKPVAGGSTAEVIDTEAEKQAPPVDPKTLTDAMQVTKPLTREEQSAALVKAMLAAKTKTDKLTAVMALMAFKKKAKVSFEKLKVSVAHQEKMNAILAEADTKKKT